jgi:hypothetical protein
MALTAHQQEIADQFIELVEAGHKRILLKGSAGTGKTFMTQELIKIMKHELYQYGAVYVCAPTHKALSVLKTKIEAKDYIHFRTIHSAQQLTQKIDFKTGQKSFVQVPENPKNPRFRAAQVVIVDEASMLESQLIDYNDDYPDLLFVYVGDHKQLPPVGEKKSRVFTSGYPEVWLQEIVRQGAGSPIIELSNDLSLIRSRLKESNPNYVNEVGGYIFENDRDYIIEKLAEVNGTDEIKYVSWTNADVDKMNLDVRRKIYGIPNKVELNESLIFTAPYRDFKNNQEIKVNTLEHIEGTLIIPTIETKFGIDASGNLFIKDQFKDGGMIKTYDTEEIKLYLINEEIQILHEDYDALFKKKANELKAKCKEKEIIWPAYYWFIERFAQFTYNHALTVHKSLEIGSYKTYLIAGISLESIQLQSNMKMSA